MKPKHLISVNDVLKLAGRGGDNRNTVDIKVYTSRFLLVCKLLIKETVLKKKKSLKSFIFLGI